MKSRPENFSSIIFFFDGGKTKWFVNYTYWSLNSEKMAEILLCAKKLRSNFLHSGLIWKIHIFPRHFVYRFIQFFVITITS